MTAGPVGRRLAALVGLTGLAVSCLCIAAAGSASARDDRIRVTPVLTIRGHGYGHGHGMSQYGAEGAALKGKNYRQIIGFYYPHTTWGTARGPIRVLISADTSTAVTVLPVRGLSVRGLVTRRTFTLPARHAIDRWRIVPGAGDRSVVQSHRAAGWKRWRVLRGDAEFFADAPMTLRLPYGSARYRGRLRSASPPGAAASTRDTVNVLKLDGYVRGVVPLEMPSSWSAQALRAQAVAARTYAAWSRAQNRGDYYHVCDTTSCQVYGGVSGEVASTNHAVKATSRRIVRYHGRAAFTQFSSSDGGWTSSGGLPYLPAKKDPYDGWSGNANHTWSTKLHASSIESAFSGIGQLTGIRIRQRTGQGDWGGRVVAMVLVGKQSKVSVSGDDFRLMFGLRSSWFAIRHS